MASDIMKSSYLQPGTKVGAYEIVNLVGHGGFGFLYRVTRDGKTYALKMARDRPADLAPEDRAEAHDRLDREISALTSLKHPNIVRVHCFERWPGLEDGYPYLVMDFVEGQQLNNWRAKTSPSLRRICETVVQIAGAVQYIHDLDIYHRDLKSENILVRRADGMPIVVDFGISRSRVARALTGAGTSLGTVTHYAPEYAAWEQSQAFQDGVPFEWHRTTDLHSLGYVFYELLTGFAPFPRARSGANFTAILQTIRTFIPILPSVRTERRVPQALDKIVMRLLEKNPADRYQTGGEVVDAVSEALVAAGPEWDVPHAIRSGGPVKALTRGGPGATPVRALAGAPVDSASVATKVEPPAGGESRAPHVHSEEQQDAMGVREGAPSENGAGVPEPGGLLPIIPTDSPAGPDPSARRRFDEAARQISAGEVGGAFNPPTTVRPSFTGIQRAEPPPEPADPSTVPLMATAIRKQAERLEAAGHKRKPNYLIIGAVIVTAVMLVLLLLAARGTGKHVEERRADLIADVEKQRAEEAKMPAPTAVPPPVIAKPMRLGDELADNPPAPPPDLTPAPSPAATPRAAPSARNEDGADIDAALRRNYGRPTVPPDGAAHKPARKEPAWLHRSTRIDTAPSKTASAKGIGVPLGSHIRAKLLSNLDSRTISGAPVEAILATPFLVGDQVILPARTLLYGQASTSGSRFTIAFTRIRLPDNSEVEFTGLALDRGDGKAGLRAGRRITVEMDTGPGLGETVAKNAATTAITGVAVTGGVADSIGKSAGTAAINNREQVTAGGENAILLDGPVLFDIFVTKAF
jgi:serine/threonine protein kinase